ncbi:hypothetical protein K1T35_35220 [Pseudonocardia sp. DSM 110487]|uniref:hypothetical protein n=1 Tax=Pseudonocardia sp. DSM 110487 TaxID=2865833 RepID=UPI001C6A5457|nr:hypothetical protein [Pseudonocardia sp. DSM 110487]QYN33689.1 hypothetical protein K1T35_35220 [Pseudonocardia sp. DSM 110487]
MPETALPTARPAVPHELASGRILAILRGVGPEHLSAVRGPFPQIAVVPTGGVDDTNAAAYLRLGAVAVAAGSWLVPARSVDLSLEQLADRAARLWEAVDAVPVRGVG